METHYRIKNEKEILGPRIKSIISYFDTLGMELNHIKEINLYIGNLHNAVMQTVFLKENKIKIYIDEKYLNSTEKSILSCNLLHELLHALSKKDKLKFALEGDLTGIDEACTQFFAEEISKVKLTEEQDYLYYIKSIIRDLSDIIGVEYLAYQYFNKNTSFSDKFDEISDIKFKDFSSYIEKVYNISRKKYYKGINENEIEQLELYKNKVNLIVDSIQNKKVK